MVFLLRAPKVNSCRYSWAFEFLWRMQSFSSSCQPKSDPQLCGRGCGRLICQVADSCAPQVLRIHRFLVCGPQGFITAPHPPLSSPWFIIQKTKFQSPARLQKGYSLVGIWARTSSLYTDFQYPLPAFSTISLIPLPSFLTSASHFCSSQGFCQVDQIPSCWYPLPSDSKTWAFLLAGKLFLVPLSTSNLHILWSGATDNSLLHQTRSSILGFWFLEEGKGYNMS